MGIEKSPHNFGKVAVLMGGSSGEREISLLSGQGVLDALLRQGVNAEAFDPSVRALHELEGFNRAFIMLHGHFGEDGCIQGFLEMMRIPYTGSGVLASALGMDKWRCKMVWQAAGLAIPAFEIANEACNTNTLEEHIGFPMFVKPACEGSSIGVAKVNNHGEFLQALHNARRYDANVIAEKAILGGEYTVAILGNGKTLEALPIIKIEPTTEFYDYDAKYFRNDTRYLCPCGLPPEKEDEIKKEALEAFKIIGCAGWGRVDFLMDEAGKHYFLEVNTSPGMTSHSLVPMAAKAVGLSYDQLVLRVLSQAFLG